MRTTLGLAVLAAWLTASAPSSQASAGEWRGWRGLEKQGRSDSPPGPLRWSPTENVRWRTPIPGKGHSSPVVAADRVFVTAGYVTGRGQGLKLALRWGVFAASVLLGVLCAPSLVRACRSAATRGQLAALACLCLVLGLLVHVTATAQLQYGAEELSTDQRMECWLVASRAVVLCLLAATFALGARSRWRLLVALLAAAFAGWLLLGRPEPEYYDLVAPGRYASDLFQAAALPLVVAAGIAVATLLPRRDTEQATDDGDPGPLRTGPLLVALAAFLLGVLALGVPALSLVGRLVRGIPLTSRTESLGQAATLSFGLFERLVAGAGVLAWLVVEVGRLRPQGPLLPRWLAVAALCLAAAGFVERNYALVTREFVRAIVCVHAHTGKTLWVREGLPGPQPSVNVRNSPATPTPVVAGGRVFAWFGTPGCLCTDLDGRVLWTNTRVPFDDVHGVAASPMPADGLLVIVGAQPKAPYITALDQQTGRAVWTVALRPWPGIEGQHRTPTIVSSDGTPALLLWGWDGPDSEDLLRALDARTGVELWRHPVKTHNEAVASILVDGDTLFLPSSRTFYALSLSKLARGQNPLLWTTDLKGKGPSVSSPVLCKGLLFMAASHRHACCLDAATGEVQWRERLRGKGTFPSPVASGDRVYFCDKAGLTTVVAAERRFRTLAESDLAEPIWASPAPVDGRLLIRTASHLWCIQPDATP